MIRNKIIYIINSIKSGKIWKNFCLKTKITSFMKSKVCNLAKCVCILLFLKGFMELMLRISWNWFLKNNFHCMRPPYSFILNLPCCENWTQTVIFNINPRKTQLISHFLFLITIFWNKILNMLLISVQYFLNEIK